MVSPENRKQFKPSFHYWLLFIRGCQEQKAITSLTWQSIQETRRHPRENFSQSSGAHQALPRRQEKKAKPQHLHRGRAGPQLHVSCPRWWRCHWGTHGELQKGGGGEKAQMFNQLLTPSPALSEALPPSLGLSTTLPQRFTVLCSPVASTTLWPTDAQGGTHILLEPSTAPCWREQSCPEQVNITWRGWQLSSHCPTVHRSIERSTPGTSQPLQHCLKSLKDKFPPFAQMLYYSSGC